jgi:hypothetical protein
MIALALLLTLGTPARAQYIGGTCVPDSDTIAGQLYHTAGFGVQFAPGKIGRIRFLCPLLGKIGFEVSGMLLSFIDPDGIGTEAHVVASLRGAAIGSNAGITYLRCDSNDNGLNQIGPAKHLCLFDFFDPHKLRPFNWWEVIIERTNPTLNVEFLGVHLVVGPGHVPFPVGF